MVGYQFFNWLAALFRGVQPGYRAMGACR